MPNWLKRLPALARGLLFALVILVAGAMPPTILDEAGVRLTPRIPWVAPVALTWVWFVWRALNRPGWRGERLSAAPLPRGQWWAALATLAAGTVVVHMARMAAMRFLGVPDVRLPGAAAISASVLVSSFFETAPVSGVFEEAAYRGYLRRELEWRYGPLPAILLAAAVFSMAHVYRGSDFYIALPFALLFGFLYGAVAWKSGSILPGVVVHSGYNLARLFERWLAPPPWLSLGQLLVVAVVSAFLTIRAARSLSIGMRAVR